MTMTSLIKLAVLRSFVTHKEVDMMALTECNMAWNKVPAHLHPTEQSRYWWENVHWSISHNHTEDYDCTFQPGGTCLAINQQIVVLHPTTRRQHCRTWQVVLGQTLRQTQQ